MLLPLALSLVLLPLLSFAEPLHLPLTRRAAAVVHDKDYFNSIADQLRSKYGVSVNKRRATSAGIAMINLVSLVSPASHYYHLLTFPVFQQIDASYVASVSIGTP
jgi:cathepsin D